MIDFKLAACVILYYPMMDSIDNMLTYIDAVDRLYVLDNTPLQSVSQVIKERFKHNDKVEYIGFGSNVGIGKALNYAAKRSLNDGYNWLLTMDQDSYFTDFRYFKLLPAYLNTTTVCLCSPMHLDLEVQNGEFKEIDITMTSGNVLNLGIWKKIGGFNEGLFIDEVDHDYCLRAKLAGYKILQINILLVHKLGKHFSIKLFGKNRFFFVHNSTRLYYIIRNNFYMFRYYQKAFPHLIKHRKKELLKTVLVNIMFDPKYMISKLRNITKGYKHARKGVFGELS